MCIAVVPAPFVERTFLVLGFSKVTGCSDCRESRSESCKVSEETITKFSQGDDCVDRVVAA